MYIGKAKLKQIILPSQRKECIWENLNKFHRISLKFEFMDPLDPPPPTPHPLLLKCHLAFLKTSCMTKERTILKISILFIKQPRVLFSQSFYNFRSFRDCLCILSPTDCFPLILQVLISVFSFTRPFIREPGAKFAPQEVCVFS